MKYLFIPALFLCASLAYAFDLNPLFTDHMVLQRELPIRIYGTAEVDTDGKWLVILNPQPASFTGRELRYAFKDFPLCNLYNSSGLPAGPFRTDNRPNYEVKS